MAVLVLMAGLAGGASMAAVAGSRRTETSYERLVEAEDAAEVFMFAQGELSGTDLDELRRIPKAHVGASTIIALSSAASGIDRRNDFGLIVAADAESLALLRPHHLDGRLPSADHPEEVVVNELVAKELQVRPGDKVDLVGPTPAAFACLEELECDAKLLNEPIQAVVSGVFRRARDLDPDAFNGALVYAGPGMKELAPPGYVRAVTVVDVKLEEGRAGADPFAEAVEARFPERFGIEVEDPTQANISRTLDVEARSLLVFAAFAAVAGLVATAQAFARHLASGRHDRRVLAALGLTSGDRAMVIVWSALVVTGAATMLAVVVAIAGSSILPVGVARRLEPYPGIDIDGAVLAAGTLGVAAVLLLAFGALAWRAVSRDRWNMIEIAPPRGGRLLALPVVPAVGVDLAAPRLRRAGSASTMGAIVGITAALAAVTAASIVASSNGDLQTTPALYGQPWDANVLTASENARAVADELGRKGVVTALALTAGGVTELAGPSGKRGEVNAVGFELLEGEMELALLAGRAPRSAGEVALGSRVFDELDVAIGDRVTSGDGEQLKVVGTRHHPDRSRRRSRGRCAAHRRGARASWVARRPRREHRGRGGVRRATGLGPRRRPRRRPRAACGARRRTGPNAERRHHARRRGPPDWRHWLVHRRPRLGRPRPRPAGRRAASRPRAGGPAGTGVAPSPERGNGPVRRSDVPRPGSRARAAARCGHRATRLARHHRVDPRGRLHSPSGRFDPRYRRRQRGRRGCGGCMAGHSGTAPPS